MDIPEIHYVRSGDVAIAYQVVGEGTFDLVFADAQGGVWGRLVATIEAVRQRGLLVVDDMRRATVEVVPDQAARTERVRHTLFADLRLLAVELDWSTGVILARRV